MKNIWKWILGILVIVAVLATPFILHYTLGEKFDFVWARSFDHGRGPIDGFRGWDHPKMHGFEGWRHSPMMGWRGHGFGFFGPFLFLGGLAKLIFFGALLYGAYWLGKRNARITLDPAQITPTPAPAPKRGRKAAKTE